jgi:ribosomal protein L4
MSPAHRGIHSTAQVGAEVDANFHLAARNLDELTYTTVADLSVWDILKRKKLVLAADALPALYERLKELSLPPYTSSAVQSVMPSMLTLSLCGTR